MRDKEKDRNRIRSLEDELGQSMNQLNVLQKEQIHLKNIVSKHKLLPQRRLITECSVLLFEVVLINSRLWIPKATRTNLQSLS